MERNWKKDITLFLGTQGLSMFGSMLVQYAIMWHITLTAKSGLMQTISIVCGFLPIFFISPFAGVWADRFDRRKIIAFADSLIALTTLVVAIVFLSGKGSIVILFITSAIRAFGQGIHSPAVGAYIPQMVPEDKLVKVNATQQTMQSAIMLVSPIVSGALMSLVKIQHIFFIDVITAAIAVVILLFFLKVPPHERAGKPLEVSYFHDLRQGIRYIAGHAYIKRFFLFVATFLFLFAPCAFLTPIQVVRSFGDDVWRLTAIEIVFSVGMMGGGIFMGRWGGIRNRVRTMALSCLVMGGATVGLGLVPFFIPYLVVMAVVGISMPIFNTPAFVLLQEKIETEYMGRVFGVMSMIQSVMMPVGMLVFGPMGDAVKIEWLLVGTGILIAGLGPMLLASRTLVLAGEPKSVSVT